MTLSDLAPAYIREIAPYQPGKPISELERELGVTNIVKLASNENPLGMSPRALNAIDVALREIYLYPDGNGYELKSALCRKFGMEMNQLVLGNGSNDVLELAARSFLTPGLSAVFSQHAFAVYPLATRAVGARCIEVPAKDFGHDLDAMLAAIDPTTRLVFIANPNNPTGTFIEASAVEAFLANVPANVLVILDEAYTEYLPPDMRVDSFAWVKRFPNLIVTHTFSKAYGLAGLRVGFAVANPGVADMMNRVRQPFNVNSLALAAATAALDDEDFLIRSYALNQAGLVQLTRGFKRLGLEYIPSCGNFVCVKVGAAADIYQKLLRAGVIVRPVASYGMPEYLRVTTGLHDQNEKFVTALEEALKST
ncbi:MAG TPA: histidinol-phosphate transaminase [Burkholderiales bacterium]|nr:histidinol-phosphate transaminase [Burkholderiales bacterium]